jgi:hypothetical protein
MLIVLIILAVLLFGGFGSYWGHGRGYGYFGGGGIGVGTVLLVLLILWALGVLR